MSELGGNEFASPGNNTSENGISVAAPGNVPDKVPGAGKGEGSAEVATAGATDAGAAEFWRLAKRLGVFSSRKSVALDIFLFWRILQVFGYLAGSSLNLFAVFRRFFCFSLFSLYVDDLVYTLVYTGKPTLRLHTV